MAEGAEDRTEAATPARLLRAKNDLHAPVARELSTFAGLAAGCFALAATAPEQGRLLVAAMVHLLAIAGNSMRPDAPIEALWALVFAGIHVVLPVAGVSAIATVGVHLFQTGFIPKFAMPSLELSRISPASGLKRLLSMENAAGAFKSIIKIGVIGGVIFTLILSHRDEVASTLGIGPSQLTNIIEKTMLAIAIPILAAQAVIAAADLGWTKIQFINSIKMSHTEVKDEAKDADGNPHVKARLKRLIAARGRQNLKASMARATVVITNPTHYAVALDYKHGQTQAPKVIAKGADDVAARIREYARDQRVPIVSNPPLARALFKLDLESEIPAEHYKAVAEVIAYVWRLSGRSTQNQRRL